MVFAGKQNAPGFVLGAFSVPHKYRMRIFDLSEGVKLGSVEQQAAFMVAVAEAYDAAPAHDPSATDMWKGLAEHTREVLFRRLKGTNIKIEFVEDDPYEIGSPEDSVKYLLYDIVKNKRMMVYTGFSDNHPVFDFDDNVKFRAVHDFFAHASVRKAFSQSMIASAKKLKLKEWPTLEEAGPLLANVRLPSHMFNVRGELNSASEHIRLAPKGAAPALFTEIIGQVCYQVICGAFPDQKVAILQDFDHQNIGKTKRGSRAERRMAEVLEAIQSGADQIKLDIKAKPTIKTADLLRGSAAHHGKLTV